MSDLIMNDINNEIPVQDPNERFEIITKNLSALLGYKLSTEQVKSIIRPWENFIRGYKQAKTIDVLQEREKLDSIIENLKKGYHALNDLEQFDMQRFNLSYELSGKLTKQDDAHSTLKQQIDLAEETRECLLVKNNAAINIERLELLAVTSLLVHAKNIHHLKPLDTAGRGKKNPMLKYVQIITDIQCDQKLDRHYRKYKKWQKHPESLV